MVPYLRAANVVDGQLDLDDIKSMNFTPEEQGRYCLRPGDVLVSEGSGSLRTVGASAVWRGEFEGTVCFQNTLLRIRPRSVATDARFLEWWCRSAFASGVFASAVTGANIFHLSAERVRALPVAYPPRSVQRKIADFLDAETARIDRLIIKKCRLIDLVQERARARAYMTISGKEEHERRKDSGLAWLGSIPTSWPVTSVAAQFEAMLGKMLDQVNITGIHLKPYLRNSNVQWDRIETDDLLLMDFPSHERIRFQILPGDLLVCEGGEPGRAAVWDGRIAEIYYQKALHRIRPRGYSTSRWLFYCLRLAGALNVFAVEGNTTTIAHITGEQLRAHRFPFPERATQERLIAPLDAQLVRDERLLRLIQTQIDRLAEHRQALITAAVTGELDVAERMAG